MKKPANGSRVINFFYMTKIILKQLSRKKSSNGWWIYGMELPKEFSSDEILGMNMRVNIVLDACFVGDSVFDTNTVFMTRYTPKVLKRVIKREFNPDLFEFREAA